MNPKIRLGEYTQDWLSCKASDTFIQYTDKGHPELPVLSASQEFGMIRRDCIGINMNYSTQNINSYKHILPGQFVIHLRSFQGGFAHSAIEGISSPAYTILRLKEEDRQDDYFWKYYFSSDSFIKRLESVTYGIRDGRSISVNDFLNLPLFMPAIKNEQVKIGMFFSLVNEYIYATDKELTKLKNLKKACLEKMFPKDGENVPEIRFGGFTGNWQKVKLNEYLQPSGEKNVNNTYDKFDIFSVSGDYGVVNQIEFQGKSFAGASLIGYKVTHQGQTIYTRSPLKAQPYGIIKANKKCDGIVSALYAVYDAIKPINTDFIEVYFRLDKRLNEYLRPLVNKGAKNTLLVSDDDALKGEILIPKDIEEQDAIVNYFANLDTQISSREKKLSKLKNIKKSLLEKMYVSNE